MTTLGGAHATAGFVIPMPDVSSPIQVSATPPIRISLTLSQVWVSPMRQVALVFDGGKVTMVIGRATHKDASEVFRTDIAEIRAHGPGRVALGEVKGSPAFVAWPRTDALKTNPAVVEFYQNGLDIHLISTTVGPSTLLAIADTVAFGKA